MFVGRSEPVERPAWRALADDLTGQILARCSGALWKQPNERFDVLGMALRFRKRGRAFDARALPGDQDLLLATIRSPFTMAFSPFTTNAHDFLSNQFFAVAPFAVKGGAHVELRVVPLDPPIAEGTRADRIRTAVENARCVWQLEARKTLRRAWKPVVRITFEHELEIDQEALHFDAYRTHHIFEPVGVVHAMRKAVYHASQEGRGAVAAL